MASGSGPAAGLEMLSGYADVDFAALLDEPFPTEAKFQWNCSAHCPGRVTGCWLFSNEERGCEVHVKKPPFTTVQRGCEWPEQLRAHIIVAEVRCAHFELAAQKRQEEVLRDIQALPHWRTSNGKLECMVCWRKTGQPGKTDTPLASRAMGLLLILCRCSR